MKTQSLLTRYAPEVDDDRENKEANNGDNLETGENEFCFPIDLDRENVQSEDNDD